MFGSFSSLKYDFLLHQMTLNSEDVLLYKCCFYFLVSIIVLPSFRFILEMEYSKLVFLSHAESL